METADIYYLLTDMLINVDGQPQVIDMWSSWEAFFDYGLNHISELDFRYFEVSKGAGLLSVYAPQALFDALYHADRGESFSVSDLLNPDSGLSEFYHDLDYAQTYGRWLCDNGLHDIRTSEKVMDWLVENGTAVYLWPINRLSVESLSTDGVDIRQVAARLDDLDAKLMHERGFGIQAEELTQMLRHCVQHLVLGESLSDCRGFLPRHFQKCYAELDAKAYELMRDYVAKRFERTDYTTMDNDGLPVKEEFYLGEGLISPLQEEPLYLSATDWHRLCSMHTELIQYGEVPDSLFLEREFWFPVSDLIGKGSYLLGETHPDKSFDETVVFSHMPEEWLNESEVVDALLRSGDVSPDRFDYHTVVSVYQHFDPSLYRTIPEAFRALPELSELAFRAVQNDPYLINIVPDNQLTPDLLKQVVNHDLSLLHRFKPEFIKAVPNVESVLVEAIRNIEKKGVALGLDHFADQGSLSLAKEDALSQLLTHIPLELRTSAVCQAAMHLHPGNGRFVPESIQQTIGENKTRQKRTTHSRLSH